MKRRIRLVASTSAAVLTVAALTATVLTQRHVPAPGAIVAHGSDRLPSESAADWTTYADHVVVATAISEQEDPPAEVEVSRGEGLINRTVRLKIDKVLWSRSGAAAPAPQAWDFKAVGWQFRNGDLNDRRTMVLAERPRVEVGHTYIMAMEWEPAACVGEDTATGAWLGLGEGFELVGGEIRRVCVTMREWLALSAYESDGLGAGAGGESSYGVSLVP